MTKFFTRSLFATLILVAGHTANVSAQQDTANSTEKQQKERLSLDIDANTFFYDAEYATPMSEGFTVTGFRLSPALSYRADRRIEVRAGFNATVFAGLDSVYKLRPTLTINYKPTQWLTLVAGTINGAERHHLDEVFYNKSRLIYNYQEDGLQILTNTKIWSSDTWIDWNHYLSPWTADQERFTFATQHKFNILTISKQNTLRIDMPLLFMANHRGGEVKTIDTNAVTVFNYRAGLRTAFIGEKTSIELDLPFYFYHLEDKTIDNPGFAFYPSLELQASAKPGNEPQTTRLSVRLGWWHAKGWFCPIGDPTYWNITNYSAQHILPSPELDKITDTRNCIILKASLKHTYKSLCLELFSSAVFDIDYSNLDINVGFAMNFNQSFFKRRPAKGKHSRVP